MEETHITRGNRDHAVSPREVIGEFRGLKFSRSQLRETQCSSYPWILCPFVSQKFLELFSLKLPFLKNCKKFD
jgi:hypothetical protein